MIISGWGRSKIIQPKSIFYPLNIKEIVEFFKKKKVKNIIPRGNGRSYGDSALAKHIISLDRYSKFIDLDHRTGHLKCSSNILIKEVNEYTINKGWFLNVTPGTKYVTIGGAIASDIHGKNHHTDGSFCDYLEKLEIITAEGKLIICSKNINRDLFKASCGGMGLTGLIISANIRLQRIQSSSIDVSIHKVKNLKNLLKKFETLASNKYLISWIDHFSIRNNKLNSIIFSGNHCKDKIFAYKSKKSFSLSSIWVRMFLFNFFVKLFNKIYFHFFYSENLFKQSLNSFFYPLDLIKNWNEFYGKKGFVQIQLLIREKDPYLILKKILFFFYEKKQISYLTTLKKLGTGNDNFLSFPESGFTLTMDFSMSKNFRIIYKEFEKLIGDHNIKIYLTKDLLMTENFFKKNYSLYKRFIYIKNKYDPKKKISSIQSNRIGI
jgi:hypothetical protein